MSKKKEENKEEKGNRKNKEKYIDLGIKAIFWVIFIVLVIGIFYNMGEKDKDPVNNQTSIGLDGKTNGIITNIWLYDESKLDRFKENNMKYLFVDVGHTSWDGVLETPENEIIQFLNLIQEYEKKEKYDFILLAYSEINTNNYDINNQDFQDNYVNDYVHLIDLGFDGILIDIEYVPEDRQDSYLAIVDRLLIELPIESVISAYVVGIDENPSHWDWSPEFFEEVAERVDLIEFGTYDTDINTLGKYQKHVQENIEYVSEREWDCDFIVVLPTHKKYPETLDNALEIFDLEISNHEDHGFIGAALFAEWTTDNSEWRTFEEWNKKIIL